MLQAWFLCPYPLEKAFIVFGMPSSLCSSPRHSEEHQVSGRIVFEGCSLMLILQVPE